MYENFHIADRVQAVRDVRAGLSEKGPFVCKKNDVGVVVRVEKNEPDGVHVRLDSGNLWWFKPSQLEVL